MARPVPSETSLAPTSLRGAHEFVLAARDAANAARIDEYGRLRPEQARGVVYVCASKAQLNRALRIAQGFINLCEADDLSIVESSVHGYLGHVGAGVEIEGFIYPFEVRESTEKVPLTEAEQRSAENEFSRMIFPGRPPKAEKSVPSGRLELLFPADYGSGARRKWSDGTAIPLEYKLADILPTLRERVVADRDRRKENERRAAAHALLQAEQHELTRQREIHAARLERALAQAMAWGQSMTLTGYSKALRLRSEDEQDSAIKERVEAWCDWIDEGARALDPTVDLDGLETLLE